MIHGIAGWTRCRWHDFGPRWRRRWFRAAHDRFRTCTSFPGAGRFPLIFLIVWVTRLAHPLGAIDVREGAEEARFRVVFSVWFFPWFFQTFKTERLPERIKGLALTSRVVARQLRVDSRKFPPLGENLFSANVEFDKSINLVLYQAIPNRGPMLLHVGFHARFRRDACAVFPDGGD